jgi:hypothetical protein
MKKATGARVTAIGEDAAALAVGVDKSPLGDEGWDPVVVDRVLEDGDTVELGRDWLLLSTRTIDARRNWIALPVG